MKKNVFKFAFFPELNSCHYTEDGATEGELANGARWWKEEGKEYLEDGKVMSWTCIRGASSNGQVEWEEKFWETSDSYTYRELGKLVHVSLTFVRSFVRSFFYVRSTRETLFTEVWTCRCIMRSRRWRCTGTLCKMWWWWRTRWVAYAVVGVRGQSRRLREARETDE